eukprot:CAMPEP_0171131686 /NCGR_PEP_ID=MMETSP0766_2-20121228/123220_1 /TAXON_ID=439317 /ORGANISM="Gambierdiscus australes, Strain CAWD 149" /LENGTH=104 /DNA_ID=CAMNT_0011594997 /DNA_START=180 /DNA_END=495 /DNA_ORIENTATION=-
MDPGVRVILARCAQLEAHKVPEDSQVVFEGEDVKAKLGRLLCPAHVLDPWRLQGVEHDHEEVSPPSFSARSTGVFAMKPPSMYHTPSTSFGQTSGAMEPDASAP